MIKFDASQTKQVIALLIVLLIIIGVAVVRVKKVPNMKPESVTVNNAMPLQGDNSVIISDIPSSRRDPFIPPNGVELPNNTPGMTGQPVRELAGQDINSTAPLPPFGQPIDTSEGERDSQTANGETEPTGTELSPAPLQPALPTVFLIGTIGKGDTILAVLKIDGIETALLGVGDVITDGFILTKITSEEAQLTRGNETITARRPNPYVLKKENNEI